MSGVHTLVHVCMCSSPAGSGGQGITATHDSFLMYTEDPFETQAWVAAITRVMYEVCVSVCVCVCVCVYGYGSACLCVYTVSVYCVYTLLSLYVCCTHD